MIHNVKLGGHFNYLEKTRQKKVDARADRERGDGGMPFDLMPKTKLVDVGIEKYYFDLIALKIYDDNNQIYEQNFTEDKTYTLSYNGKDYEFDDLKFSLKNFKNLMGADTKKLSENMYVKIQLKKKSSFLPQSVNIKFTKESIRIANDNTHTKTVLHWPIIAKMVCFTEPFQIKIQDKPSETRTGRVSSVPETSHSPVLGIDNELFRTNLDKIKKMSKTNPVPNDDKRLQEKLSFNAEMEAAKAAEESGGPEPPQSLLSPEVKNYSSRNHTVSHRNDYTDYSRSRPGRMREGGFFLDKSERQHDNMNSDTYNDELKVGGGKRRKTKRRKSKTKRKKSLKKKSLKKKSLKKKSFKKKKKN